MIGDKNGEAIGVKVLIMDTGPGISDNFSTQRVQ